jgi:hypothetical protein
LTRRDWRIDREEAGQRDSDGLRWRFVRYLPRGLTCPDTLSGSRSAGGVSGAYCFRPDRTGSGRG